MMMMRLRLLPILLLSALLVPRAATAEPAKLALLVGISKYQQGSKDAWRELHTAGDLAQLQQVLRVHYGFLAKDIVVLQDEQATGEGIRQAFKQHLINRARPGSVVVFHFSGHGQQLPDDDGDEQDGLDESLVPYDTKSSDPALAKATNLRDDEMAKWLDALKQKMREGGKLRGSISVFFDSCFSGTATRGILVERGDGGWDRQRFGPPPAAAAARRAKGAVGLLPAGDAEEAGYIFLAAARSDQTAKEVDGMGAFSRALTKALAKVGEKGTYREIYDLVLDEITGQRLQQTPVYEGAIDTRVFSGVRIPIPPYLNIQALADQRVRLLAGELHGVTPGSIYTLYRAGSGPLAGKDLLGEAVVDQVDAFTSRARLRSPLPAAELVGGRALEKEHMFAGDPLRVHLVGLADELERELRRLPMLVPAGANDYQVEVSLLPSRTQLAVRRASQARPIALLPADGQAVAAMRTILLGEWRWQQLARLRTESPRFPARVRLVPVLVKLTAHSQVDTPPVERQGHPAGREVCLSQNDYFMIDVENLSSEPRYITLLELDPEGNINVLFPNPARPSDSQLATGVTRLAYRPYVFRVTNAPGRTQIKAIVTREPLNLTALVYKALAAPGMQRTTPELPPDNPELRPLLQRLFDTGQGDERKLPMTAPPTAFGTAEAWLEIPEAGQGCAASSGPR